MSVVTTQIMTEQGDTENQFNSGLKMIVSSYENQKAIYTNEITNLKLELEKKNSSLVDLEKLASSLLKEKSNLEAKIANLSDINNQLNKKVELLLKENNDLRKIKDKIFETIQNKNQFDQQNYLINNANNNFNDNNYIDNSDLNNNDINYLSDKNQIITKIRSKSNISNNNTDRKYPESEHKINVNNVIKQKLVKSKSKVNSQLSNYFNNFNNSNNLNHRKQNNIQKGNINNNNTYFFNKSEFYDEPYSESKFSYNRSNEGSTNNNTINIIKKNHSLTKREKIRENDEFTDDCDFNNNRYSSMHNNKCYDFYSQNSSGNICTFNPNSENCFFQNCKNLLRSDEYNQIINIAHQFNSNKITKEKTYQLISDILSNGNYKTLINEFDKLFSQ